MEAALKTNLMWRKNETLKVVHNLCIFVHEKRRSVRRDALRNWEG